MKQAPRRMIAIAFIGLLAFGAIMSFAPTTTAQGICVEQVPARAELNFDSTSSSGFSSNSLDPYIPATVTAKFIYSAPEQGFSLDPVPVTLEAKTSQSWLQLGQTEVQRTVRPVQGEKDSIPVSIETSVLLTADAPQGEIAKIDFEASATDGTCVLAPVPVTESFSFAVGFYEQWSARFDGETIIQTGQNSGVLIPMVITNFGNGDIDVTASYHEDTSGALQTTRIPKLTVESRLAGEGQNREEYTVNLRTPFKNGYENRYDEVILVLNAQSVLERGRELNLQHELSAQIQTQGVYVPGFGTSLLVFAVAGLAATVHYRRR